MRLEWFIPTSVTQQKLLTLYIHVARAIWDETHYSFNENCSPTVHHRPLYLSCRQNIRSTITAWHERKTPGLESGTFRVIYLACTALLNPLLISWIHHLSDHTFSSQWSLNSRLRTCESWLLLRMDLRFLRDFRGMKIWKNRYRKCLEILYTGKFVFSVNLIIY